MKNLLLLIALLTTLNATATEKVTPYYDVDNAQLSVCIEEVELQYGDDDSVSSKEYEQMINECQVYN